MTPPTSLNLLELRNLLDFAEAFARWPIEMQAALLNEQFASILKSAPGQAARLVIQRLSSELSQETLDVMFELFEANGEQEDEQRRKNPI